MKDQGITRNVRKKKKKKKKNLVHLIPLALTEEVLNRE